MLISRHNVKIFIFFLLFSTPQRLILLWNEEVTAATVIPPSSNNNICVTTQNITKGPIDARVFINQGGTIVSDLSKLFDPKNMSSTIIAFKTHWCKIIAASIFVSYIYILYQIRYACLLIKEHNAWCNWKSVIPVTHLQLASREELLAQLKIDIYKKYARNGLDKLTCDLTTMFMKDINAELQTFDTYLDWQNRIQTISCNRLFNFPFDVTAIEEKKARLFFIIDLFMVAQAEKS